jgi:hypothetical protein
MSEEQAFQVRPGRGYRCDRWARPARRPEGTDRRHRGSDPRRRPVGGDRPVSSASIPPAVVTADETGARQRAERVGWLRHAVASVGLRAGLSRMAGAVGALVVLIGGCTDPIGEPAKSYPVIVMPVCNDWASDARHCVDRPDAPWCAPRRHVASVRRRKAEHRRIGDRDLEAGPGGDRNGRTRPAHANVSLPTARTTRS